jgi:hypothetical protein
MLTAIVEQTRVFPTPHILGTCPYCGNGVRSKCGSINTWHFSHLNLQETCDYWKEHESEWHREWKSWFPLENTEYIKIENEEKHIADVHLDNFIFELQNSPISYEDRIKREEFWGIKLRWIVKSNFDRFKLLSFERDYSRGKRADGKFPRECVSHYGEQLKEINMEELPLMWVWKNPKRWITTNPPLSFYIDLTGSNFILLVNRVIENNFGFGILKDRPTFISNLKQHNESLKP